MISSKPLKIAQLNVARKRRALLDLLNEKCNDGHQLYDLCLITEPPINPGKKDLYNPSDKYKVFYVEEELGKSYHVYSAIYILNNLNWQPVTHISNAYYAEVKITSNHLHINVGSIYCPGCNQLNNELKKTLSNILATRGKKIIGGDFNAHHDDWEGRGLVDSYGRFFKEQFDKWGWLVHNTKGEFTRKPTLSTQPTVIDLTITNSFAHSLVENWTVTDSSYGSDHLCIQFELKGNVPKSEPSKIAVPSRKITRNLIHIIKNNKYSPLTYELLLLLHKKVKARCEKCPPRLVMNTTFSDNKKVNLIRSKINKINRALKQYSCLASQNGQDLLYDQQVEVINLTHQLKMERCKLIKSKEKEITCLRAKALKKKIKLKGESAIWKELNIDISASHNLNLVKDEVGNVITNHKDLIITIMKRLAAKQTKQASSHTYPKKQFIDYELQHEEIDRAIASLNSSKARGTDEIGASFVKELHTRDKDLTRNIIQGWWDTATTPKVLKQTRLTLIAKSGGAIKDLDSLRPIGIGNHLLIAYERIINERLYFFVNKNILVKEQLGYRKGLSLVDSLGPFIKFITDSLDAGHKIVVWKADIESAFESINTNIILEILADQIPNKLWLVIKDLLTDREVVYSSVSPEYKITFPKFNGTTQGSALSPTLFATVMGILHRKFASHLMKLNRDNRTIDGPYSFADDLFGAFLIPAGKFCEEVVTEASQFLSFIEKSLNNILSPWNLKLASNKLDCVILKTRFSQENVTIINNNCNFILKQKVKVLGLTIGTVNGSLFGHHITEKCQEVLSLLDDYKKNTWHYSFELRKTVIHRVLIPKLFYLGELWANQVKTKQVNQLNSVIRLLSIYAIGGASTISHVAASTLAAIPPAFIWIKQLATLNSISSHGILFESNILKIQKNSAVCEFFHPADIPQPEKIQMYFAPEESLDEELVNDIHIYTDASLGSTNGGIAVVAPKTKKSVLLKTHKLTNPFELELKAIHIALLMAEDLFAEDKKLLKKIVILTDSLSSLTHINNLTAKSATVLQIRKCFQYHKKWNRTIHLIWVKGHFEFYGNELADALAKEAINNGHHFTLDIPIKMMKIHLTNDLRREWKEWFQSAVTTTKHFSEIFSTSDFPPDLKLKPDYNLTALLTSHTPRFNAYKKRFFKETNGNCICDGVSLQTGHHALTSCSLLRTVRLQAYAKLDIKEGLYENKSLQNIKKDDHFVNFAVYVAKKIREYW